MYTQRVVFAPDEQTAGATEPAPVPPVKKARPKKAAPKANGKPAGKVKAKAKAKAAPAKKAAKKARKARAVDPTKLDQFGFRKGTIKSKAAAMYALKKGATLADVKEALDSTQFNLLTELEAKGYSITRTKVDGGNGRKVTRFKIEKVAA